MKPLPMTLCTVTAAALVFVAPVACAQADAKKQADARARAVQEDIMDHRTMADAHRKAAECLEAGRPEKQCHEQLAKDCKGVAIGRTCGMKHRHKH